MDFCRRYNIEFVTEGPNVAGGNINIKCPLCSADPSHHMGLSLDKPWWACWRDRTHRGSRPNFLVRALLNVGRERAQEIIYDFGGVGAEDIRDVVADMQGGLKTRKAMHRLEMPDEFVTLNASKFGRRLLPYRKYLAERGFPEMDQFRLAELYDIRGSLGGEYQDRLILPVYYQGLATWTGRSIHTEAKIRYKTLSTDPDKAVPYKPARYAVTDLVYNFEQLVQTGGVKLYIVEGPFDALKIDFYGRLFGYRATCLFGLNVSDHQRKLLFELARQFDHVRLMVDPDAWAQTMALASALVELRSATDFSTSNLPDVYKDAGAMSKSMVKEFLRND